MPSAGNECRRIYSANSSKTSTYGWRLTLALKQLPHIVRDSGLSQAGGGAHNSHSMGKNPKIHKLTRDTRVVLGSASCLIFAPLASTSSHTRAPSGVRTGW